MSRRPKILFLSSRDIRKHNAWAHHSMAYALDSYVGEVIPLQYPQPVSKFSYSWLHSKARDIYFSKPTGKIFKYKQHAQLLKKIISKMEFDILFAPMGSGFIAYLEIDQPIIYLSDATYQLMINYYHPKKVYTTQEISEGNEIENAALNNASKIIATSDWSARSICNDYKIDSSKVHIIYSGPNLEDIPSRDDLKKPDIQKCANLLMVGRKWERKGGDIGLETIEYLHQNGYKAELTICGMTPPSNFKNTNNNYLKIIPFLDKSKSDDMQKLISLYNNSHFLLFPSRAECHGLAINEANAFGTPVLANNTGGIPDYVKHGISGMLFEPEERGTNYADMVIHYMKNPESYLSLSANARDEYESRLNWKCWSENFKHVINGI